MYGPLERRGVAAVPPVASAEIPPRTTAKSFAARTALELGPALKGLRPGCKTAPLTRRRTCGRARRRPGRPAESAAIALRLAGPALVVPPIATFAAVEIPLTALGRDLLDLGPLRAEGKILQLREVYFVQTLLVAFVGGLLFVHDWA